MSNLEPIKDGQLRVVLLSEENESDWDLPVKWWSFKETQYEEFREAGFTYGWVVHIDGIWSILLSNNQKKICNGEMVFIKPVFRSSDNDRVGYEVLSDKKAQKILSTMEENHLGG